MKSRNLVLFAVVLMTTTATFVRAESFKDLVGEVSVGEVKSSGPIQTPFIVWGGDIATFHANGGLLTKQGTIFAKQGLNLSLVPGDNFPEQVRNYMSGKSPFLRGTFGMLGMAAEVTGSDPRTKPVVFLQMTKSLGDHAVSRANIKTLKDLKGATVCLQKTGPHESLLDDLLKDANLTWNDIKVVWVKDLNGPNGPAEAFRKDSNIGVCFVITPDMIGLCGGMQSIGNGVEGTVKGAHVLASTADRPESIYDVYACRKDWYDANKPLVTKFAAGYLKACEEVMTLSKAYQAGGSKEYMALLQMTQDIYGKEAVPTLENDAHGLVLDCVYVLQPGNVAFFGNENAYQSFDAFQKKTIDLALTRGYLKIRQGMIPSTLDWSSQEFTSYLKVTKAVKKDRFDSQKALTYVESLGADDLIESNTIYTVVINFGENQSEFSALQYSAEFQKVIELSQKYTNSVVAIRGHADPKFFLKAVIYCGMQKGVISRNGAPGNYKYFAEGKPLDITSVKQIATLVQSGKLDGVNHPSLGTLNPSQMYQAAKTLARKRSESVRAGVIEYATKNMKGVQLDLSQIHPIGVGFDEPVNPLPQTEKEQLENMRVEFSLVRVKTEVLNDKSLDIDL